MRMPGPSISSRRPALSIPAVTGWNQYLGSTCRCWDLSKIADDGAVRVEWYIQVDGGTELYALSTAYLNQSFDKQGRPYGLVITQTGTSYTQQGMGVVGHDWFNYPCEGISISQVYPELWNWLTSSAFYDFSEIYSAQTPANAFPAAELKLYETTKGNVNVTDGKYLQN